MTASLVRVARPFLEEVLFRYVDESAIDFTIYFRFLGKTKITFFLPRKYFLVFSLFLRYSFLKFFNAASFTSIMFTLRPYSQDLIKLQQSLAVSITCFKSGFLPMKQ